MSDIAVSVRGVSKSYTIAHDQQKPSTLVEALIRRVKDPFHRPTTETFWALKDVSFDIKKGDVVGIIGRNGAGKSTLLKILSRITEPTEGEIHIFGRIGSLLEVGTGFHPELTGRENVFLNGAILGMTKSEIRRQFDAIVDFAGVEKFLDTPVKRYSSGMYVRLAFAVAAHLQSEILIVDEVLAVGDSEFQQKCIGKMQEVSNVGRTVLFVSHNMATVKRLCKKCAWMVKGNVRMVDETDRVITAYLQENHGRESERHWVIADAPGTAVCRLRSARVCGPSDTVQSELSIEDPIHIEFEYELMQTVRNFRSVIHICTEDGIVVLSATDGVLKHTLREPGRYSNRCTIPGGLLNEGKYYVTVAADVPTVEAFFHEESAITFDLVQTSDAAGSFAEKWAGVIRPKLPWTVQPVIGAVV